MEMINHTTEIILSVLLNWVIITLGIALIGFVVHFVNIFIKNKMHQKIVGVILIPILVYALVDFKYPDFSEHLGLTILIIALSASFGFFVDIIDDIVRDTLEDNLIIFAIIVGFAFGGTWMISAISYDWKTFTAKVIEVASVSRVEIYVYTQHTCTRSCGEDCTETYDCSSYDYNRYVQKINFDYSFPELVKDKDYKLGVGYLGREDDVHFVNFRAYALGVGDQYKWFACVNPNFYLERGESKNVNLNYFEEIKSVSFANEVDFKKEIKPSQKEVEEILPVGGDGNRIMVKGLNFFFKMFVDKSYKPLRLIYLFTYLFCLLIWLLFKELRQMVAYFVISSLIIPFLILALISSKSEIPLSDFKFGGGDFGGGGAGGHW